MYFIFYWVLKLEFKDLCNKVFTEWSSDLIPFNKAIPELHLPKSAQTHSSELSALISDHTTTLFIKDDACFMDLFVLVCLH